MTMRNNKKITFISYHNWKTKRHGGFHQFAEYASRNGYDVIFFSFSRPYYTFFKKEERLNANVLKDLSRGVCYSDGSRVLYNITWPTLALPGYLRKYLPGSVNKWLMTHSLIPFSSFQSKWLKGTDVFVFESCDAVYLLDLIKKYYNSSKIIYRPSDPIVDLPSERYLIDAERRLMISADKVFLVNEESRELYRTRYGQDYNDQKAIVIPNGVDVSAYLKNYDCPEVLDYPKTSLYVGVFAVDWKLIEYAARQLTDVRFVVVNPNAPSEDEGLIIHRNSNIIYVPGINPETVPQWVKSARVIMQPFPENNVFSRRIGLSLTAMHYKAMAAKKPIIAHMVKKSMERYGLVVTETKEQFTSSIKDAMKLETMEYNYDIKDNDWSLLCEKFLNEISK